MWLVTGDTHGLTGYDARKIYPNYLKAIGINIEDIDGIIICGDFGGIRHLLPFIGGIAMPVCELARNDSVSLQATIYLFRGI